MVKKVFYISFLIILNTTKLPVNIAFYFLKIILLITLKNITSPS